MTKPNDSTTETQGQPHIRWWPAAAILLLAVVAVVWVRFFKAVSHQEQNIGTAAIALAATALWLLWVLFFSRLKWRIRFWVVGGVLVPILVTAILFRIRGVSGDLVPIFEWRWHGRTARRIETAPSKPPGQNLRPPVVDYPQFLGPNRNATVAELPLARHWKAHPPAQIWRGPVGAAWSGFAVVAPYAITQEQRAEEEAVVCYDLLSGKEMWVHGDAAHYRTTLAGEGPRATPTIVSNRVYALGAMGLLNCLDLSSGKVIWSKNIIEDNQSKLNEWGMSGSPLALEDLVLVSAGGRNGRSLVAYHAAHGGFVWGGGQDGAGYSSPFPTTLAGDRQILIFNAHSIAGHDALSGQVLWEYPWPGGHPHVALPVVLPEDRVLVSSGYGTGSELLKIKKDGAWSAARLWKSNRLKAKFTNVVYLDGHIYGLDDGIMVCLDASNGELEWKEGRYGHGQVILTGHLLLIMAESGDVVLMEPTPQEHRELTRFTAFKGKTWNPPALAGEYLLVRNDKEAACYRLPLVK